MIGKNGIPLRFISVNREGWIATVQRFLTTPRGEVSKEIVFFFAFIAFAVVAGFVFTR